MIWEKLRQIYPQLTKNQKRLADFLANNYRDVAFMTASELAKHLDVNEATVIRFAQRLDYAGYPDLVASIQDIVKKELSAKIDMPTRAWIEEPILQVLTSQDENLRYAISVFPADIARQVLDSMRNAKTIYLLGQGVSAHLAGILDFGLRVQGFATRLIPGDTLSLAAALRDLNRDDLVIGLCAGDSGSEIVNVLQMAREAGSQTVAFASSAVSPVAQAADLALTCPANDQFVLPSVTILVAFIDAFLQLLASDHPQQVRERWEKLLLVHEAITKD